MKGIGIPSLNLTQIKKNNGNPFARAASQTNVSLHHGGGGGGGDTQRVNGERGFLLDFFEKFHDAHESLTAITTFTRVEFFKETYMIEALAVGLPNNFLCAADQEYSGALSARSGRSSNATVTIEQQTVHQELQMLSNLKAYFKEHQIDVTDLISMIKQEKRIANSMDTEGDDKHLSKAYWQLATLIFVAFYLDHSQNDFLSIFFAQRLQTNVQKLKLCLNIVQGLLAKSELIANEEEEMEDWALEVSQEQSMEIKDQSMDDILSADTSQWDPFRDAHKFEALAAAEQNARRESVKSQFDIIKQQEEEERNRLESAERTEDLEASIHLAESKLEQKDAMLRQRDQDQACLVEQRVQLEQDLQERDEEIAEMRQKMVDQEMAMQREQLAMREMHTLIVRLQDKAAQNQELKMELEEKDRVLQQLGQEKNRLEDEARVSRLSLVNMGDEDIAGQLSGRAFQESSPARRRREKQEQKRREREDGRPPEVEMTKMKAGQTYGELSQNEFEETPYKGEFDDFDDLQKELGGQTVDGTFELGVGEAGLTGEEYFETNPNDTSYEMQETDNTNRDLMNGEDDLDDSVPIDMRSPDVTQILEGEKEAYALATKDIADKLNASPSRGRKSGPRDKDRPDGDKLLQTQIQLQKVQAELSEYRVRCSKQKERIEHIERLNREHEQLYTEFLVRSIKAERDKRQLERRLTRINYIIAFFSRFQCSKPCLKSWADPKQFTWKRGITLIFFLLFFILIISLIAI